MVSAFRRVEVVAPLWELTTAVIDLSRLRSLVSPAHHHQPELDEYGMRTAHGMLGVEEGLCGFVLRVP